MDTITYDKNAERLRLGSLIKTIRESKGMTQDQVCELSGLTRATIINIEKGRFSPGIDVVGKIAKALQCKLDITKDEEVY